MSGSTPSWLQSMDPPEREVVDPRELQVHRPTVARDVPYVPTDQAVVDAMLRLADVGPGDVLYDLGCGDGRIPIAAAKRGARAVGVEIDLQRLRECLENATRAAVRDRTKFLRQSFFEIDLSEATVVTMYLLPSINVKLRPKLLWELRPGARVVTNYFDMGDWAPDERLEAHRRTLYRWNIPAWLAPVYHGTATTSRGRRHFRLAIKRNYQLVTGFIRLAKTRTPIFEGRLFGSRLSFKAPTPCGKAVAVYSGDVSRTWLRGMYRIAGEDQDTGAWAASPVG